MTITTTPQKAKVYAIFDNPAVVFTCRVNQTFSTHDKVFEFAFDGVTVGAYTDVLPGMTILLGSTLGGHDKGIIYCRKAPTSSKMYCGETSEVAWANDLYVSVLQDWAIWNEYLRISTDTTVYMKYDVAYSDQHSKMKPVPILGPDRVLRYEGAAVTVTFNGSSSYAPGSSIASHAFSCAGATVTGGSTATPSMLIATPGRYVVAYTVTSAQGVSSTTYRTIHVWSDRDYVVGGVTKTAFPVAQVTLGSLAGDFESGGWSFQALVLSDATSIRERTKVILFSEEWYADTKISYAQCVGAENIVAIGWMDSERITINQEQGEIEVSAQGTQYWLQQVYNFVPMGIEYCAGTPAAWTQMHPVTVDKVLWNHFMWRSTVTNCVDVFLSGDTREATELVAVSNSLWEQVKEIAYTSILAAPCCDRYGRIFVEIETVLLANAGRGSVPNRGAITAADCEQIGVEHTLLTPTSQVILSGVSVTGSNGAAKFSMSRGHIPMHYGTPVKMERLLLSTQALSNELAGNLLEKANAPYRFAFEKLLYNNRLVDICPRQFVTATIEASDNPRGIAYSGNAIVKHIDLSFEDGAWEINWDAVPETLSVLTMNGDIPTNPGEEPWNPPEWPPIDWPGIVVPKPPPPLIIDPPVVTPLGVLAVLINGKGIYYTDSHKSSAPVWYPAFGSDALTALPGLATLFDFAISPLGVIYAVNTTDLFQGNLSDGATSILFSQAQFEASAGGQPWPIHAIGFKTGTTNGLALLASGSYPNHVAMLYSLDGSGDLEVRKSYGGYGDGREVYAKGTFTNYQNAWYFSGNQADVAVMIRFLDDLSGFDGTNPTFSIYWPAVSCFHVHASEANIIYSNYEPSKIVWTGTEFTKTTIPAAGGLSVDAYAPHMACDPTGQYVMCAFGSVSNDFRKSSDFGATFSALTGFESLSYDGRDATYVNEGRIYNLGNELEWLVAFRGTIAYEYGLDIADYLHLQYTADGGTTWTDIATNLRTLTVDNTAQVLVIRSA